MYIRLKTLMRLVPMLYAQMIYACRTYPTLKGGKAGDYSIYIVFPDNPEKRQGYMRVYAGRAASQDEAMERASIILNEAGGDVTAVEIIDWSRPQEGPVYRIGRDGGPAAT